MRIQKRKRKKPHLEHAERASANAIKQPKRKRAYLPGNFEAPKTALGLRQKLKKRALNEGVKLFARSCTKQVRCGSGLCPICVRRFRKDLLRFLFDKGLQEEPWVMATVRPEAWLIPAGDHIKFTDFIGIKGSFGEIPYVKKLLRLLRRCWEKRSNRVPGANRLIVLGSIESNYDLWCNEPAGKPFHLHLGVLGLKARVVKNAVDQCARKSGFIPPKDKHLNVTHVATDNEPERGALTSYVFKQPFWKLSKFEGCEKGRRQEPKPHEILELALNYGVHGCPDRLIRIGIEYRGSSFRFSKTESKKNAHNEKHPKNRVTKPSAQAKYVRKR